MKEREAFLDRLRISATLGVVLLHTVTGVTDTADMSPYFFEYKIFLAVRDLVCWCVPVFLLISGYLFLSPSREITWQKILTKYCRRVVLALFLFGAPYALMEQIAVEGACRWGMLWESIRKVLRGESWAHMWYLYLILFLYLLTPLFRWLLFRIPRMAVYLLITGLLIGSSLLPYAGRLLGMERPLGLPDGSIYFFYYIGGYLFAMGGGKKEKPRNNPQPASRKGKSGKLSYGLWGAVALLGAGMAASRLWGGNTLQLAYNDPFYVVFACLLFGAAMAQGAEENGPSPNAAFRDQAAALSFAVYLVHPVFLNFFYKYLHITLLDFPIAASLPAFFLGTLLLSFGTAWVLGRIPPLRKYVL